MHQSSSFELQDKEGELIKATGLRPGAASQKWVSPANLTSLLQEVRHAKSRGQSVRLVGGNTGPGVYKDWPVDVDVLIGTTGVPELTNITSRQVLAIMRLVRLPCLCCLNIERHVVFSFTAVQGIQGSVFANQCTTDISIICLTLSLFATEIILVTYTALKPEHVLTCTCFTCVAGGAFHWGSSHPGKPH